MHYRIFDNVAYGNATASIYDRHAQCLHIDIGSVTRLPLIRFRRIIALTYYYRRLVLPTLLNIEFNGLQRTYYQSFEPRQKFTPLSLSLLNCIYNIS